MKHHHFYNDCTDKGHFMYVPEWNFIWENFKTLELWKQTCLEGPQTEGPVGNLRKYNGDRNGNGKISTFRLAKQYFNLHVHHAFWTLLDDAVKLPFTFVLFWGRGGGVCSRTQFSFFFFFSWKRSFKIPFHKNRHYLEQEELLKCDVVAPGEEGVPNKSSGVYAGRLRSEVQPVTLIYRMFSLTWPASMQIY